MKPTKVDYTRVKGEIFFKADDIIIYLYKEGCADQAQQVEELRDSLCRSK